MGTAGASANAAGQTGGLYGGGGGGGAVWSGGNGAGSAGANGLIVITYFSNTAAANASIINTAFQPDLIFIKSRTSTSQWYVADSIRGLNYSSDLSGTTFEQGNATSLYTSWYYGNTNNQASPNSTGAEDIANWSLFHATATANTMTAPDGTLTAATGFPTNENSAHNIGAAYPKVAGQHYIAAVFAKINNVSRMNLGVALGNANYKDNVFDMVSKTFVNLQVDSGGYQDFANGWMRIWVGYTCVTSNTIEAGIYLGPVPNTGTSAVYASNGGTEAGYFWGATHEATSALVPTEYISVANTALIGNNTNLANSSSFTLDTRWWINGDAAAANNYIAYAFKKGVSTGINIVNYLGTDVAQSIAHGLGTTPVVVMVKARSGSSANNGWAMNHDGWINNTNQSTLYLNSSNAVANGTSSWSSTWPDATNFYVGGASDTNKGGIFYVAYVFSEVIGFSRFYSYTGNGNAAGPYVDCGFQPQFVMIKSIAAGNWTIVDSTRTTYNPAATESLTNSQAAEATNTILDLTTNGFKIRSTSADVNTNGVTYIFMAFAEAPTTYANAQ